MTTQETADELVKMCRAGNFTKAYDELFAENAEAIEPEGLPDNRVKGLDNLREKSKGFAESVQEMHSMEVSNPIVAGQHFSCTMKMDITFKEQGRRKDEEVCVYETNSEGKIVKEQFFYPIPN